MLSNLYLQAFFHCIISPHQLTAATINLSIIIPHKSPHLNARKISKKCHENVEKDRLIFCPTGTDIQDSLFTDKKIIHFSNHRSITLTDIRYLLTPPPLQSSLPLPSVSTFPLWKMDYPEDVSPDIFPDKIILPFGNFATYSIKSAVAGTDAVEPHTTTQSYLSI